MPYTYLNDKLRIGGWAADWPYDACKKQAVEACHEKVLAALKELSAHDAGRKITKAVGDLSFTVDLIPTTGDGAFLPVYNGAISGQVPINKGDVSAIIIWDISKNYTPAKGTVSGEPKAYPPWVLLAHELGHAIQMEESGGQKGAMKWHQAYMANMEGIEMDNITRHESPFVSKLGLPCRIRYNPPKA